ncbi:MAG TPA: hypothetical protein VF774_06825 [Pseudoduganella sp.]
MANRTYLMAHSNERATTAGVAEDTCLLAANHQVPILWLALFDDSDLTFVDVPCTDEEGNEVLERIPTFFTSLEKASATYGSRRTNLAAALGAASANVLREWEEFLSSAILQSRLQIDLIELLMMYDDPADFLLDVRDWSDGVACQSGHGWQSLCSQAHLDDPEVSRYGLRGFPWNANIRWS